MYPILEDKSNNPFPDLPPISYTDVYRQFKYSNIPDFMITDELKMNVPRQDQKSFEQINLILNHTEEFARKGLCLFLSSTNTGNGKTTVAVKILKSYIHDFYYLKYPVCYFCYVPEFSQHCTQNKFSSSSRYKEMVNIMRNCEILVLDDLPYKQLTGDFLEQLILIVNHRVNNRKSIICTGNVPDEKELRSRLGDLLYSRLYTNSRFKIEFFAKDRRGSQ